MVNFAHLPAAAVGSRKDKETKRSKRQHEDEGDGEEAMSVSGIWLVLLSGIYCPGYHLIYCKSIHLHSASVAAVKEYRKVCNVQCKTS